MYDISKYLNTIGDFSYESSSGKYSLLGTMVKEKDNAKGIVFRARIPVKDIHMYDAESMDLYGTINSMKISLLNCHIKIHSYVSEAEYTNAIFELDKIVIGEHYKKSICIQHISTEVNTLNFFYMTHISNYQSERLEEKFFSDSPLLAAETKYGKVSLQPYLAFESTCHQLAIQSVPCLKYSFKAPKTLDSAISHLASIRNLFTFFADGYIDFNTVEYNSDLTAAPNQEKIAVTVFLNQPNDIPETNVPFLLSCSDVKEDFKTIVENWLKFYENSIYIPSLFFEIITNSSRGINEFLNLAQAVEIYSSYFRNEDAKIICNNDPDAKIPDTPSLKHRLIDVFSYLKDVLGITEDQRDCLAGIISRNRNFYTHYSSSGKEPSFKAVSRMILLLRFVVLALVYKHIGINDSAIKSCKSMSIYTSMDDTIRIILANEQRSKNVLD